MLAAAASAAAMGADPVPIPHAVMNLTLVSDPGARCSDGAQAGFYYHPGSTDDWQILLNAESNQMPWCYGPDPDELGATSGGCKFQTGDPARPPSLPPTMTLLDGIMSDSCAGNPDFCRAHKVVLPSCDGAAWLGDADRSLARDANYGNASRVLLFRGARILRATMRDVLRLGRGRGGGIGPASRVVVLGRNGGGNTLYHVADRLADFFRDAAGVPAERYAVIPMNGFYPQYGLGAGRPRDVLDDWTRHVYDFANVSGSLRPECLAATPAADRHTCMYAARSAAHLRSRAFPLEQAWGTFGSFCQVDGYRLHEPAWGGWHIACKPTPPHAVPDPAYNVTYGCVEFWWRCTQRELDLWVNALVAKTRGDFEASGLPARPGNGGFMHSCHLGDEDTVATWVNQPYWPRGLDFWNVIAIDGVTMQQAVSQWWRGGSGRFYAPCLWNESYAYPNGMKNLCNPSCAAFPNY